MNPPDRLPGDQRAVLQLVLGQGHGYDEIAGMLSIAPEQVRDRAHAALDALGPPTDVPDAERGRIADYLLGQLSGADAGAVRDSLAASPAQRAWARVVSGELNPLAAQPLPQVADGEAPSRRPAAVEAAPDGARASAAVTVPAAEPDDAPASDDNGQRSGEPDVAVAPRSSRAGGIVLLSLVAAAAIAAIVIFVIKPGGSSHPHSDASVQGAQASAPSTSGGATSKTTSSSQSARIVGQIKLAPPAGGTKTTGAALVLSQGSLRGLGIEAVHVPPNTTKPHTAYAVWLYNSPTDAKRLGYVNPPVSKNGKLDASAQLPANATRYKLLIITLETATGSHTSSKPGPVVLEGKLSDVPKSRL
jgi:Sigma-70, region 4